MSTIKALWALTRPKFLVLSVIPVIVAASLAMQQGPVDVTKLLWCLSGVVMLHMGGNVANDCYDYLQGADHISTAGRYSGGSGVLPQGLITVRSAKLLFSTLFCGSLMVAFHLSRGFSYHPFFLALLGVGAGLFYTAPPLKLAYRGLGELAVALSFGPGIVLGTFYVLRGHYTTEALLAGGVLGLLIGSVLVINEFRDAETDLAAGKRTLAVRLKCYR